MDGGHVAIAPLPTLQDYVSTHAVLICFPRKRDLDARLRPIGTMGKSILIFRNRVKPVNQKYSA
jgi:hypothetical protein